MSEKLKVREFIKVISLLGKRKNPYLLAVISCAAVDPAFQIIFALVSRKMFNAVEYQSKEMLIQGFILMIIMFLIYCIVQPITAYHYEARLHYPMIDLRRGLLSRIIKLPMSFFEKNHSGDLMSALTNDFEELGTFYREYTYDLVSTFFLGVGSILSMFLLDIRLSILMIALSLVTTGANTLFSERLSIITRKIRDSISLSNQQLSNLIGGLRVIKIYAMEDEIIDKYKHTTNESAVLAKEKTTITSAKSALSFSLSIINFIGVLSAASFMVAKGSIDFGTAMAVIMLQEGATSLFANFGAYFTQFRSALGGAGRIFEIIEEKEESLDSGHRVDDKSNKDADIEFKDVCFGYRDETSVLENLSFSVKEGETLAIAGPSGGGKSTIAKLLLGFYLPKRGSIVIKGKPIYDYTIKELRAMTAYVPQEPFLFNSTIEENIRAGNLSASRESIISAAKTAYAHDFIMELPKGYDTVVGEGGNRLSGGQRQRIAIARAILKDAPILIFDEATSALDFESEAIVQNAMEELLKNRTAIVIAHRESKRGKGTHLNLGKCSGV